MSLAVLKLQIGRRLERRLPPGLLGLLVWPGIAGVALRRALGQPGRNWRDALAGMAAGRPGLCAAWRHLTDELYLALATCWPDRWREPRWADRFRLTGLADVQQILAAGTPVVIAVAHFNHMSVLRYALRSRGIAAASLMGFRGEHPTVAVRDAAIDRTVGLEGVPNRFVAADLRSAYGFLRSGHCLLVACDVVSPQSVAVTSQLGTLQVAVGPFRLAQMTGGVVVPAILWQRRRWRFEASFGEPIRSEGNPDLPETYRPVAEQCMRHWLPVMQAFPTQYDGPLGRVWRPETSGQPGSLSPQRADT